MPPSTNRHAERSYWVTWVERYAPNSMNEWTIWTFDVPGQGEGIYRCARGCATPR